MGAENDIVSELRGWAGLFGEKTPASGCMTEAAAEIVRLRGEVCSCPSGDGSLRWPCKAHPPESIAPAEAKGDVSMEADNAKAADAACLLAIASGYAWNGSEWLKARTPQPSDGGAVAEVIGFELGLPSLDWASLVNPLTIGTKLYTHLPAAQVQQEAYQPVRFGGIRRPSDAALAAAFWEYRQRENAVPSDLCDSKLVKFGNDIVQRARELAPHVDTHPAGDALGAEPCDHVWRRWHDPREPAFYAYYCDKCSAQRDERPATPQHRGDSRGGEAK